MAKKTLKADYDIQDVALGLRRELLSHKKNADAIYYRNVAEDAPNATSPAPATAMPVSAQPLAVSPPPQPSPAAAMPAVDLPSKPLTPTDTITILVAVALKKSSSEIDASQTIKALCGGKSSPRVSFKGVNAYEIHRTVDCTK